MTALNTLLSLDPIAIAEECLGEEQTHESNLLGLGLALQINKLKKTVLDAMGDTKFGISYDDTIRIVEAQGFQLHLTVSFLGKHSSIEPTSEEMRIYWHPELHAMITMESYQSKLNTGTIRYAWKANDPTQFSPTTHSSGAFYGDDRVFVGDFDIREAFVFHLNRMKETGTFIPKWPDTGFLWLLHWMDTHGTVEYDYKAITHERAMMLPQYIRDAIGYAPDAK